MYKIYEFIIYNKKLIKNSLAILSAFAIILIIISLTYLRETRTRTQDLKKANSKLLELQNINIQTIDQLKYIMENDQITMIQENVIESKSQTYFFNEIDAEASLQKIQEEIPFSTLYFDGHTILDKKLSVSYKTEPNSETYSDYVLTVTYIKEDVEIETSQGIIDTDQTCSEKFTIETMFGETIGCVEEKEDKEIYTVMIINTEESISGKSVVYSISLQGKFRVNELQEIFDLIKITN